MFKPTDVGARHVGIIQSLLTTLRFQGADSSGHLVDVVPRMSLHPVREVGALESAELGGTLCRQPAAIGTI